jgi:hypothetical protein
VIFFSLITWFGLIEVSPDRPATLLATAVAAFDISRLRSNHSERNREAFP